VRCLQQTAQAIDRVDYVVYLEADDLHAAFTILRTSAEPFDRWFRDSLGGLYRIAWDERFTAPELVLDLDTNRI
jgi:hypothetical protein